MTVSVACSRVAAPIPPVRDGADLEGAMNELLRRGLVLSTVLVLTGCVATITPTRLAAIRADPVSRNGQAAHLTVYPYDEGRGSAGLIIGCLRPCPQGPLADSVLMLVGGDDYAGWRGDRRISREMVLRSGCAVEDAVLCARFPFYFEERIWVL
jgi:hypothetical protein